MEFMPGKIKINTKLDANVIFVIVARVIVISLTKSKKEDMFLLRLENFKKFIKSMKT